MRTEHPWSRAVAPVVGVLALLALTVVLAATVAVGVGFAGDSLLESGGGPDAAFDLEADANQSKLTLTHVAGDEINVETLELRVAVDGTRLAHQPPVPFVGSEGYRGAPSGPFNPETDPEWRTGEEASLRVAGTNDPAMQPGDTVSVTLVVDGSVVTELEAKAV